MKKLIAMDMDGTLLRSDKTISPRTAAALLRAQQAGAVVALASGRPTIGLQRYAGQLELARYGGLLVAYNGARVIDCRSGGLLLDRPIPPAQARAVLEHIRKFDVITMFDRGDTMYVRDVYTADICLHGRTFNVVQYESRACGYLLCEKADLAAFVDFPLSKIQTAADPEYLQAHWREMAAPFAGELNCIFTSEFYFEYMAPCVDKADALDGVLGRLGFTWADVVAFGDSENDIAMLRRAGQSYAMANAAEPVRQAAGGVTLSNDADGIAAVVETLPL